MKVYIVRMKFPSAPKKSVEIMIKGDSLDEAMTGGMIEVFKPQRVVELKQYTYAGCKPNSFFHNIYYRRDLMRKIVLGRQVNLPF